MIKKVIKFLPPTNYTLVKQLCLFLSRITTNAYVNKMTAQKLAIVFAPNLLKSNQPQTHMEYVKEIKTVSTSLMTTLIEDAHEIFQEVETSSVTPTKEEDEVDFVLNYRDKFIKKDVDPAMTSNVRKVAPRQFNKKIFVRTNSISAENQQETI